MRFSPKLGWKLLIDLLPERGGSMSFPIYHPNFRDWQNGWQQGVSVIEYNKHTVAISERIIGYIKEEPETRWLTVIENLSNMPLPYIAMVVNQLDKDLPNLPHAVVSKINEELRKLISNHRRFSTAKWALPKPYVDRIAALYQKTLPEDLGIRYKFLFDSGFPEIVNPLPFLRHQESFEHIEEQRKNALEDIWNKLQIAGIEQLVKAVELPGLLGTSLENTTFSDQIESIVLNWLDNQDPLYVQTAQAYVRARCTRRKNDWLEYIYLKYKNAWSDKTWVNFCLGLPFNKRLFDFLGQINGTAKELFWENCNRYYLATEDSAYANSVLKELLRHKRPFAAISAASNYLHTLKNWDIDYELLAQSLEKAISEAVNAIPSSRDIYYDFQTIITKIQECGNLDQKRLARIEWLYMPIYRHNEIRPKVLTKEVLENAEFFVDLICLMFRANPPTENELPELPAPLRELQAQSAFYLLHLISEIPGQHGSNEVIATELEEWVKEARQRCTQKNRKVIGDEQIGEILSYAPVGKDNIWPHEAVRDIIEQCASPDIERGIEVGRFNQGGATVRASSAGGEQERKIAEDYASQAEKIKFEFPRTASMLLRLADTYRHQATFEDREILED